MQVRVLTEADVAALGKFLLSTFAAEHSFAGRRTTEVNVDRAHAYVIRHVTIGKAWVVEDDDGIAGSLSVIRCRHWWSDDEYLSDGWFYVCPQKRASRAAVLLLRAAEAFASGMMLKIDVSHAADLDAKDRFFGRMGFARCGASYAKEC